MNEIEQLNVAVDKLGLTVTALLTKVKVLEDRVAMMELAEQFRRLASIPEQRNGQRTSRRTRQALTGPRPRLR